MKPRFRFRLRTLMIVVPLLAVVSLLAVGVWWLSIQEAIVWNRKQVYQWVVDHRGYYTPDGGFPTDPAVERPSYIRRLFGDQIVVEIHLPNPIADEDARRIREAFPGVRIFVGISPEKELR